MLRRTYDWLIAQANAPYALWLLAGVSFIESSVFPIPPDVLLIPMVLAAPHRAWLIAGVCTIASVLGGLAGYAARWLFASISIGQPILQFYGYDGEVRELPETYNEWGAWAVLIAGVTPFPYKVITICPAPRCSSTSVVFTICLVRGARGCGSSWWRRCSGSIRPAGARSFIEKRLGLVFTVFAGLLFGGFLVARTRCEAEAEDDDADRLWPDPSCRVAGSAAACCWERSAFSISAGLPPCPMCIWQRWPHLVAVVLGALAVTVLWRLRRELAIVGTVAMAASVLLGIFHAGVEQGWWDGPSTCVAGDPAGLSSEDLMAQIMSAPLVRCDEIVWTFLGLSMAAWNAVLSLGLAVLWGASIFWWRMPFEKKPAGAIY